MECLSKTRGNIWKTSTIFILIYQATLFARLPSIQDSSARGLASELWNLLGSIVYDAVKYHIQI